MVEAPKSEAEQAAMKEFMATGPDVMKATMMIDPENVVRTATAMLVMGTAWHAMGKPQDGVPKLMGPVALMRLIKRIEEYAGALVEEALAKLPERTPAEREAAQRQVEQFLADALKEHQRHAQEAQQRAKAAQETLHVLHSPGSKGE